MPPTLSIVFKTSHECAVELIAHTMQSQLEEDDEKQSFILNMDLFPATAARVSFGNDLNEYAQAKDVKLINYLAEHKHTSTFEHQSATFMIECPLFIRSQIQRHRTFSYNEISRRYTSEELEFWVPDKLRGQAKNNKQASSEEEVTLSISGMTDSYKWALSTYEFMVEKGVAREIARAVLPQSLLTRFYMTGNLRNWAPFLELRISEHSQEEVQVPARKIAGKLRELWPTSCAALGIE